MNTSRNPDAALAYLRYLAALRIDGGDFTHAEWATMADNLAQAFRELDDHLTAGGRPPEAWREGPDAPGADTEDEHSEDCPTCEGSGRYFLADPAGGGTWHTCDA